MDIAFNLKSRERFNFRVGALILDKEKILMATNEKVEFYYTIGGK